MFAVLADPWAHADIDGTGWVQGSVDGDRITADGEVFRMAMFHENHPDKRYQIANLVETTVTLIYDWSGVPPHVREYLQFPPFGPEHLDTSLQHLSDLIGSAK